MQLRVHVGFFLEQIPQGDTGQHRVHGALHCTPQRADGTINRTGAEPLQAGELIAEPGLEEPSAQQGQYFPDRDFFWAAGQRVPARLSAHALHPFALPQETSQPVFFLCTQFHSIPNCSFAPSDIFPGFRGGSHTISTRALPTPSTAFTLVSTSSGSD